MKIKRSHVIAGGAVVLLAAGGIGVAAAGAASSDDDDANDVPITGTALDEASAAALDVTGGGTVTETEVGDEEGYYEIEVTLDDGSQVDVHLDENFAHLGSENDGVGEDSD